VKTVPNERGHFGLYGGMFVPETLMSALHELAAEYDRAKKDQTFQDELSILLRDFAGRPTPLYFAERLTRKLESAKIYLKREDLLHTGAHKINNALGQILLAQRMGKRRIIAASTASIISPLSWSRAQTMTDVTPRHCAAACILSRTLVVSS